MEKKVDFDNKVGIVDIINVKNIPLHTSNYLQIIFVLEGEIELFFSVKNQRLKKGEMRYIHYGDIIGINSREDNKVLFLRINPKFATSLYPDIIFTVFSISYKENTLHNSENQHSLRLLVSAAAISYFESPDNFPNELKKILDYLWLKHRSICIDPEFCILHRSAVPQYQTEIVSKIISTIYHDYDEKLSLSNLSNELHLSRDHLSHLFSQSTGLNFREFVNMARVEKSVLLLLTTDFTLDKISMISGFSHNKFYKSAFLKWCGIEPETFKSTYKSWLITNHPEDITLVPYIDSTSLIYKFLISSNRENVERNFTDLIVGDIKFNQSLSQLTLKLLTIQLACREFTNLMSDINQLNNSFSIYHTPLLNIPDISIEENFSAQTLNKRNFSLDDVLPFCYSNNSLTLFEGKNSYGLYKINGSKTIFYYYFMWLLSLPPKVIFDERMIMGQGDNHITLIIPNLRDNSYHQTTLTLDSNIRYICFHYSLDEKDFNNKDLSDKQIPLSLINNSLTPTLTISSKEKGSSTLSFSLSPRTLNCIFLFPSP